MVKYIPDQGDIVTLDFDPQSGHEQKGRRPAVIVSNKIFNSRLGLAFACPITSTRRGFPFHIEISTSKISGFIMTEQMKSIDYNAREIKFVEKIDSEIFDDAISIIESIIGKTE